tara:strand:+ start:7407 stop:7871 length:465 start_codon:yes stop_codon:yes gene_type:complete
MSKKELRSLIKTEITAIYLTSDDKKFLNEYQAIIHESELEEIRKQNRRWRQMKIDLAEIVLKVLEKERWGIFFKNEPMQVLPVQDSATTLYKVNEVNKDQLVESIKMQIEKNSQERIDECRNQQAKNEPQIENESQIDNESSNGIEKTSNDTNR